MMNKHKKIVIASISVIGLLLIVPFLIPMQSYLRQAEKLASEHLGQSVSIDSAHLFLLPSPHVTANDIVLGKNQALKIATLKITPTLSSLFSDFKTIDLQFNKPVMKKAAFDFIMALSSNKKSGSDTTKVHVRHIEIDELQLNWTNVALPILNADLTLSASHALEFASIASTDGALKLDVIPNGDEQLIALNIKQWILPSDFPLLIDKAKFEMRLKDSQLAVPSIDIEMYGGKITGEANLNWSKNWKLNGKLYVDHLAVQQPSRLVSKSVYLSGNLFADGIFSSVAKEAGSVSENLQTNFQFKVNNGVLHGLDLVKIASLLVKQKQGGGETQFDAFSGELNSSGKQYHLRNLLISSGLLVAKGQIKVKSNKALDGAVTVNVKNSMGLAEIPLDVSGTVSSPMVLPNKAALAGAIAGSAVLPGVGTSIGMKAGQKADDALNKLKGLFGN
jgi:AsmA family